MAVLTHAVLMTPSLVHALLVDLLHHKSILIVRTFHSFVEFANVSVLQVSSLPANVKLSVRNSVVVVLSSTVALLALNTRQTTTVLPTQLFHRFALNTFHAPMPCPMTSTLATTLAMSMVWAQVLAQATATTEHLIHK